jgi:hypothetical protein
MNFILPTLLVVLGVVCRVAPHPWNFAPVGAIALFAGATYANRRAAIAVPLVTMFLGDTLLELFTGNGYHGLMPVIYATYALIAVLGMQLRDRRNSPLYISGGSIAASTIFFVITNLAVWPGMYPRTLAGLTLCFVNAIPFFDRTLMSDLMFSAIFFGAYALAGRAHAHRFPSA